MDTIRKGVAAAGCVAFIATSMVACGTENISAGTKVERAVDELGKQKAITMTFGFDGTEEQIWAAMKGQEEFTHDTAAMLADLDISLAMSSKKPLKDAKKDDASVAVRMSYGQGKDVLEFRGLGGDTIFLRVDLKKLMSLTADAGDAETKADMKEFESFVDSADKLPRSYQSVKDALAGKWVSIDPKAYEEFSESMGEDADAESPFPDMGSLDSKDQQEIAEALRNAIGRNAKFTDAGSHDDADHVKVTIPAGKTADAIAKALKPMEKQLPEDLKLSDLEDVPNKNVDFDLAIKDGMLSAMTIDVAQFDKKVKGKLPMSVGFAADAEPIKAPAGVTTLNPQDIMGAIMQIMMGEMGEMDA